MTNLAWPPFRLRFGLAALLVIVALASGASLWLKHYLETRPPEWVDFSAAALERYQQENRIVVVSFQADWDVSSAVNQKMIERPIVARWMRRHGAIAMHADYSRPSRHIKAALNDLNHNSVPVIAIYLPDHADATTVIYGVVTDRQILKALENSIN